MEHIINIKAIYVKFIDVKIIDFNFCKSPNTSLINMDRFL